MMQTEQPPERGPDEDGVSPSERTEQRPNALSLTLYNVSRGLEMKLEPAPFSRNWMDMTSQRFANRCLPLLMSNQSGWFVKGAGRIRAMWEGKTDTVKVEALPSADGKIHHAAALSHFGHGILTFNMPWLIRTPEGWNLHVRGPPNWFKEGIQPCEGIVETDWAAETFTMNWKFTTKDTWVTFQEGDPIALLVPVRRGDLELFRPEIKPIESNAEMLKEYQAWSMSRNKFLAELKRPGSDAQKQGWQKDYFTHARQRKLNLASVKEAPVLQQATAPPLKRRRSSKATMLSENPM